MLKRGICIVLAFALVACSTEDWVATCAQLARSADEPGDGPVVADEQLDIEAALLACRNAVDVDNSAENQYRLARVLAFAEEIDEALELLSAAAHAGYAPGEYVFGLAVDAEEYSKLDKEEGLTWIHKAAEHGHLPAQIDLAWFYANGDGVEQSDAKSTMWFRRAAEQGDAESQSELGLSLMLGLGVQQNDAEAAQWLRKAAEKDVADAQFGLAILYQSGRGVTQSSPEALTWLRRAVEAEHALAQAELAAMFMLGMGVERDLAQAVDLARKSAEQEEPHGQNLLGKMYAQGIGVSKDPDLAFELTQSAANQDLPVARANLGAYYVMGLGVQKNTREGARWLQQAIDAAPDGSTGAELLLGRMYATGDGVRKNPGKARALLQQAARSDNAAIASSAREGLAALNKGSDDGWGTVAAIAAIFVGLALLSDDGGPSSDGSVPRNSKYPPAGPWKARLWCWTDFHSPHPTDKPTRCRDQTNGTWIREGLFDRCNGKEGWCEG